MEILNCPICLETLLVPTLTECGHSFCLPCAEESLRHRGTCSLCRAPLIFDEFSPSPLIEGILSSKMQLETDEVTKKHVDRLVAFQ